MSQAAVGIGRSESMSRQADEGARPAPLSGCVAFLREHRAWCYAATALVSFFAAANAALLALTA